MPKTNSLYSKFLRKCQLYLRVVASPLLLILCSLVMLLAAVLTLFHKRRWYAEYIAAPFGQMMLKLWGIDIQVHGRPNSHQALNNSPIQTVYISNHSSTLDLFALIALGLPNTRFFLSGYLRKLLPLGLIGYLIGNFWTVPQEYPEQRTAIFKRATATLQDTGESVYLSPEGQRVTDGSIGHFNKGAFHLATELGAPIVPLFIFIPPAINPGTGLIAASGTMHVYFGDAVDTTQWRLDDLIAHKDGMRESYIAWQERLQDAAQQSAG